MTISLERLPRPGETVIGGEFSVAGGGKGANQAVAAARVGGSVTLIARIGQDAVGGEALERFRCEGINVDYVVQDANSPSGVAFILVGRDGQNSIAVASGANAKLTSADVRKARDAFGKASLLLLQLECPLEAVEAAVEMAVEADVRVILNPAPARPLPNDLLRRVWILTPNELEAELLSGIKVTDEGSAEKAAKALVALGPRHVIVTLGAKGAVVACEDETEFVPGFTVPVLDTTGAGDVFNGALAVALGEGLSIPAAARFANAAAAVSVSRLGAQVSAPTRAEFEPLLKSGMFRNGPVENDGGVRPEPPAPDADRWTPSPQPGKTQTKSNLKTS